MKSEKSRFERLDMVVYDLAGTTLRVDDLVPGAFQEEGIMLSDREILDIRGRSKHKAISMLMEKHLDKQASGIMEEVHERFQQRLEQTENGVEIINGAKETFQWLKERKLRIALITGFERRLTALLQEWFGKDHKRRRGGLQGRGLTGQTGPRPDPRSNETHRMQ